MSLISDSELLSALSNSERFEDLVTEWGIDEVHFALGEWKVLLERSLGQKSLTSTARYKKQLLLTQIMAAHKGIKLRRHERNRREQADASMYAGFAERLAEALYLLDPSALEAVEGLAGTSATEWLHVRVERRSRKQIVAGVVPVSEGADQ